MNGELDLTAAIEVASAAIADYANKPGSSWAPQAFAEIALKAAAELIVADTRRKVAEEIEASADGYDGSYVDGLYEAAAIARGSGNGDSDTGKPTGAQPI